MSDALNDNDFLAAMHAFNDIAMRHTSSRHIGKTSTIQLDVIAFKSEINVPECYIEAHIQAEQYESNKTYYC